VLGCPSVADGCDTATGADFALADTVFSDDEQPVASAITPAIAIAATARCANADEELL
jgi:hypothetical protein